MTRAIRQHRRLYTLALALAATAIAVVIGAAVAAQPEQATAFVPAVNAAKDPTDIPAPIHRLWNKTVTVNLTATEVVGEIAPGKTAWMWTFNGTVPGPLIRVMVGDTVVINLTNRMDNAEPHNIDLHATMGPGGGAAVTNVEPGETKTLTFKALRAGGYIYHCAGEGMAWEHVSYGMYGMIMVEPLGGLPKVDREFYVGQSDWYLMENGASAEPRDFLAPDTLVLDEERAFDERPTMYSFNGHQQALTDPGLYGDAMHVRQNGKVRIFMVTGGPNKGSNFHVIGQIFDKVYLGAPSDVDRNEETVYVAPGSAGVFEMSALVPGTYLLVDHALWRVPLGAAGHMHVDYAKAPTTTDPLGSWPLKIFAPQATGTGH